MLRGAVTVHAVEMVNGRGKWREGLTGTEGKKDKPIKV